MKRPVVYKYFDYRVFLKDMFQFRKLKNKIFSYRYFSSKSGFSSPNFLKLVIDEKRNLTNSSIAKVAKGFGLKKQEREFFENLVFMNQATVHDEKNHYYKKMMSMRGYTEIHKIDKDSYNYFSKWYYPVIREVITFNSHFQSPEKIARLLFPKITAKEAERAIKLLSELGLIKQNQDGHWEQSNQAISTGSEVKSLVVGNYHREMIKLASESIDRHPAGKRDISALTLSVKEKKISEIKARIESFRKELMDLACQDENPDQVIQINIQAFPLTNKK